MFKDKKKAKKYWKKYRKLNRAKINFYIRRWAINHPERSWAISAINIKRRNKIKVDFTIDELTALALKHEPCPYCGAILDYSAFKGGRPRPNSPSLDRIDNAKDKININDVQILCNKCNMTKLNRTHNEFLLYCQNVIDRCHQI